MRNQTSLSDLFNRYINNECSSEEIDLLLQHFDARENEQLLTALIRERLETNGETQHELNPVLQRALISIKEQIRMQSVREKAPSSVISIFSRSWKRYAVAAAILIAVGGPAWFWFNMKDIRQATAVSAKDSIPQILPGGNRATLTLADGSTIILDSASQGTLASQNGIRVIKLSNGQLSYHGIPDNDSAAAVQELYNTISTPKGGQYQIILPDGSNVWLNAASSLRFPTRFLKETRSVELTGEAYFEIAQKINLPFIVKHNNTQVQVLGTSFNMNAYADEDAIRTTLLDGSVKIIQQQHAVTLKPGQQATVDNNDTNPEILVQSADTEEAIAWKNGLFVFNNADIRTIMRQVARWYDVDIRFEGKMPEDKFIGELPRNSNVSEVLKIMELNNVHFKIKGKTITLTP